MSNCAQHHDYKGAIGYCPRCRIAELEAQKTRSQEHYINLLGEKESELAALRKAAQDVADQRGTFTLWSCSEAGAIRAIDKLAALLQEKGE